MKARILYKHPYYYIQIYAYEMDDLMVGGRYVWKWVRESFFKKKSFVLQKDAEEYARTVISGSEGYEIVKEIMEGK